MVVWQTVLVNDCQWCKLKVWYWVRLSVDEEWCGSAVSGMVNRPSPSLTDSPWAPAWMFSRGDPSWAPGGTESRTPSERSCLTTPTGPSWALRRPWSWWTAARCKCSSLRSSDYSCEGENTGSVQTSSAHILSQSWQCKRYKTSCVTVLTSRLDNNTLCVFQASSFNNPPVWMWCGFSLTRFWTHYVTWWRNVKCEISHFLSASLWT